jgi:drug/metabolite transporter (DMT)-like permease
MNAERLTSLKFLVGLVLFDWLAQFLVKKSKTDGKIYFFLAIGAYTVVCLLLYYIYNHLEFYITNSLWDVLSTLIVTLSGVFFFKESINNYDKVALGIMLIGMIVALYSPRKDGISQP